ncbi:Glycosyl transferase, family I [Desulfonema limicola]|uniref:Glycosyl transferase, family I n=1 Tax=Desulfonema limicola TaxID=45656 RepID=A0A975GI10_9BACT|nr:glycosyltransferase family 4 protein [Desulfonema limicola]QTA82047.1 Glycosyl transferase, family I [Desulfonema limicola]
MSYYPQKLKILAVSGKPLKAVGGAERSFARLCCALSSKCQLEIIASGSDLPFQNNGTPLTVHICQSDNNNDIEKEIAKNIKLLQSAGRLFDIIYLCDSFCIKRYQLLFLLKQTYPNAKIVFKETTGSGKLIKSLNNMSFDQKRLCMQYINAIVCISSRIRQMFLNYNTYKGHLAYIPNGIDTDLFSPTTVEDKIKLRKQFDLPINKPIFLFTGRFTEKKNLDVIYGAWLDMERRKGDWAMLVLIGKLHNYYDEGILHMILKDLKNVRVTGPFYLDEELANWYKASDFFIAPTSREGLSNAFLEASSAGLYPIVTPISGYEDIIINEELGMLVEERNTLDVIRCLKRIAPNPEEFIQRGREKLRKKIVRQYDIKKVSDMILNLCNDLVKSK